MLQGVYSDYDFAIATVDHEIKFSQKIRPICLPKDGQEFEGKKAIAAGWWELNIKQFERYESQRLFRGATNVHGSSNVLMETSLRVLSEDECTKMLGRHVDGYDPKNMICSYEEGTDACQVSQNFVDVSNLFNSK
jgi:hypothetical protein